MKGPLSVQLAERLDEIFYDAVNIGEVRFAARGRGRTDAEERHISVARSARRGSEVACSVPEETDWASSASSPGSTTGL